MTHDGDEIALVGLVFFGTHGVNPEENTLGQRFGVDLHVWLDLSKATESDLVHDTVSYSALFKLVRAEVEGQPSRLLEHLAGRILRSVIRHDRRIRRALVRVAKLNPPLKGSTRGEAAVAMERDRSWADGASE